MDKNTEHNASLGRQIPAKTKISAKGLFLQNDIYEQLKFAYTVSPRNTVRAFRKVGIVISGPQDLFELANLHNSGNDVAGFHGRDGMFYAFNVREILNRPRKHPDSIRLSQQMFLGAPIEWTDMVIHQGMVKILK